MIFFTARAPTTGQTWPFSPVRTRPEPARFHPAINAAAATEIADEVRTGADLICCDDDRSVAAAQGWFLHVLPAAAIWMVVVGCYAWTSQGIGPAR
jgi:hypothetical protein